MTSGSSLLARGKQHYFFFRSIYQRIIPARAGKTKMEKYTVTITEDHPCSRGENKAPNGEISDFGGSSPLARGKHPTQI